MIRRSGAGLISHRHVFVKYVLPLLLYVSVIFSLSSLHSVPRLSTWSFSDKIYHAVEYSLLPVLFFRFLLFAGPRKFQKYYFFAGIVLSVAVAASDEWYQSHVPNRTMDFFDLLADMAGIWLCAFLWYLWRKRRQRS